MRLGRGDSACEVHHTIDHRVAEEEKCQVTKRDLAQYQEQNCERKCRQSPHQ